MSFSTALCSRVEDAGLNASAPPEQRWLDGWLLRLSPGKAKRARCINAVAEGRLPLAERLQWATSAYREAGLAPILRVTPFTRPLALAEILQGLGWRRLDDTRVMLLTELCAIDAPAWQPRALAPQAYAEIVGALRGSPPAQIAAHARRLLASPVPYQGYAIEQDGAILACGQAAIEADLVGLYDVFTAPAARGQGLGGGLCRWLLARAVEQGARHAYLQVEADNAAARAIYQRLGFADAYAYHYLTPATGAA